MVLPRRKAMPGLCCLLACFNPCETSLKSPALNSRRFFEKFSRKNRKNFSREKRIDCFFFGKSWSALLLWLSRSALRGLCGQKAEPKPPRGRGLVWRVLSDFWLGQCLPCFRRFLPGPPRPGACALVWPRGSPLSLISLGGAVRGARWTDRAPYPRIGGWGLVCPPLVYCPGRFPLLRRGGFFVFSGVLLVCQGFHRLPAVVYCCVAEK